jgi:hypothetical protein
MIVTIDENKDLPTSPSLSIPYNIDVYVNGQFIGKATREAPPNDWKWDVSFTIPYRPGPGQVVLVAYAKDVWLKYNPNIKAYEVSSSTDPNAKPYNFVGTASFNFEVINIPTKFDTLTVQGASKITNWYMTASKPITVTGKLLYRLGDTWQPLPKRAVDICYINPWNAVKPFGSATTGDDGSFTAVASTFVDYDDVGGWSSIDTHARFSGDKYFSSSIQLVGIVVFDLRISNFKVEKTSTPNTFQVSGNLEYRTTTPEWHAGSGKVALFVDDKQVAELNIYQPPQAPTPGFFSGFVEITSPGTHTVKVARTELAGYDIISIGSPERGPPVYIKAEASATVTVEAPPTPTPPTVPTGNVVGHVYEEKSKKPIVGVKVGLAGKETTTNSEGYYEFSEIPEGNQLLAVYGKGTYDTTEAYFNASSPVTVVAGQTVTKDMYVLPVSVPPEEIPPPPSGKTTVKFVVYDSTTKAKLSATVQIANQSLETDANGELTVTLDPGDYDYSVSATGYYLYAGHFSVQANQSYIEEVPMVPIPATPPSGKVTLTVGSTSGGTTDPAPGIYTYDKGTKVTLTAKAYEGYKLDHWLINNQTFTQNPITITLDQQDTIAIAYFSKKLPLSDYLKYGAAAVFVAVASGTGLYLLKKKKR